MSDTQLLDNVTHQSLRVHTQYSRTFGDNKGTVITFPSEVELLHKEYPLLFKRQQNNNTLQLVALLGFASDENLFLAEQYSPPIVASSWVGRTVPGVIAKGPFLIGYQRNTQPGGSAQDPMVHIDMQNPRLTEATSANSQAIFLPHGGQSPYLQKISKTLDTLHTGMQTAQPVYEALDKHNLITPVSLDVTLINGEKVAIQGYETINDEVLQQLNADTLQELHQQGLLKLIYQLQTSLGNIETLIELKHALEQTQ